MKNKNEMEVLASGEYLVNVIEQSIQDLKNHAEPMAVQQILEFYTLDSEVDVEIQIRLIPKLSQYDRGTEVFLGEKK